MIQKQFISCPKCHYKNESTAIECTICQTNLSSNSSTTIQEINKYQTRKLEKGKASNQLHPINLINFANFTINSRGSAQELKKPINLIGLAFLTCSLVLWLNYLIFNQPKAVSNPELKQEVASAPEGIFSYGGAPIFAPLVASGINGG